MFNRNYQEVEQALLSKDDVFRSTIKDLKSEAYNYQIRNSKVLLSNRLKGQEI